MDRETEELFSGLATRFDSALARQEDRAAGDLARSLACGRDTRSLVAAGARVIVPTGTAELVATLGTDYCTCGEGDRWVVPLAMAELVVQSGHRPQRSSDRLIPALRRLALRRPQVEVFGLSGRRSGALRGAGPDHLQITTAAGLTTVPIRSVRALRLVRGG